MSIFASVLFMSALLINYIQCIPDLAFFNASKLQLKQTKVILRKQPIDSQVNPRYYAKQTPVVYKYKQVLNQPTLCSQHRRVFLLYAIRTYYKHFDRRQVLRDILNQPYISDPNLVIKHIFLFGRVANKTIEETIRQESEQYKDIIQEDFAESYINVSYKAIMAWKWSVEFCPNAHYVFVMNDELFVDQNKVVNFLLKDMSRGSNKVGFSLCYFKSKERPTNFARNRNLDRKYMYQGKFYPKHCHGVGYIAHIEVINRLYKASLSNPPMMPTDVWIGILVEKLNLKMTDQRHLYVVRNIRGYFENAKYLSLAAMAAITDEEVRKDQVAKMQRQLFNTVQRQWKKLGSSRKKWSPRSPTSPPIHSSTTEPIHYLTLYRRKPLTNDFGKSMVLEKVFSMPFNIGCILILILLALIVLTKKKCLMIIKSIFMKGNPLIQMILL